MGIFAILLLAPAFASDGSMERLHILLSGDIYPCPVITLCMSDPLYDYTPLQTREIPYKEANRYVRLYFPRTREKLIEYSMLFFVDADMSPFNGKQVAAMVDSVREGHVGTFWTFGPHYGSVVSCNLQQVVPHEMSHNFNQWAWGNGFYRVSFRRDRPPVFTPFIDLGIENVRAYGSGRIIPRTGTTIWADMLPFHFPWMVSWKFGGDGGTCWVAADDLDHPWWSRETYGFCENLYAVDVLANIISYTVGRELPEDVMVPILIRRELLDYNSLRNLFVSVLEFVEKFGADTSDLYDELTDIDDLIVDEAKRSYLDGEYDEALSGIRLGNEKVRDLSDKALKFRESTLLWVFVVEWFVVSGTCMLSGFVLWTLMVRRKVYREVATTRLLSR